MQIEFEYANDKWLVDTETKFIRNITQNHNLHCSAWNQKVNDAAIAAIRKKEQKERDSIYLQLSMQNAKNAE